ncbi:MAG TPA: hypothetical protein VFA77_07240, partial [Candidatus Eisenbacteria bacterium]|nr:hypothetical protein [Candidatus Eisenbacteria bacterium]
VERHGGDGFEMVHGASLLIKSFGGLLVRSPLETSVNAGLGSGSNLKPNPTPSNTTGRTRFEYPEVRSRSANSKRTW